MIVIGWEGFELGLKDDWLLFNWSISNLSWVLLLGMTELDLSEFFS
jgi:hypothetical protein